MGRLFRVVVKALRQSRYDRPTPEEVLSGSERALLREVLLIALGVTTVAGILSLLWMMDTSG